MRKHTRGEGWRMKGAGEGRHEETRKICSGRMWGEALNKKQGKDDEVKGVGEEVKKESGKLLGV